jgi:uncharacterized protein (UPF0332 family)
MEETRLESVRLRMVLARTLAIAKRLREECDYNERKRATEEEAKLAIADAEDFVREARRILEKLSEGGARWAQLL